MSRLVAALAVCGLLFVQPGAPAGGTDAVSPGGNDPAAGIAEWVVIRPDGETGCAFGTSYQFFYREGPDPSKLMVYFQGGGACWNWVSCAGMFDQTVTDHELASFTGIFDFDNPANPFQDYSVVFVPYCTGDVHVGDTVAQYGEASWNAPAVRHWGYRNVTAVVDWVRGHVPHPDRLVVTGASAGSYGALFHAPNVAALFPSADLTVIGDSGVPLLHEYPRILDQWGARRVLRELWSSHRSVDADEVTLEAAHEHLARLRPDATIAQITTDRDGVQTAFYIISGSREWRAATLALLESLEDRIPRFRAFVLAGGQHGLMRTDAFYSLEENGVSLRDWIESLITGKPVASQFCKGCLRSQAGG